MLGEGAAGARRAAIPGSGGVLALAPAPTPRQATPASPRVRTTVLSSRRQLFAPSRAAPGPISLSPSAASPFLTPFPPASRSLVDALERAERRRRDSRVPGFPGSRAAGLPAPAAREQQAPGICGLRTGARNTAAIASWDCLEGSAAPPYSSPATGPARASATSVQCGGVERAPGGIRCLCWSVMGKGARDYLVMALGPCPPPMGLHTPTSALLLDSISDVE